MTRVVVLHSAVYMSVHMGERGRRCSAVYIETHGRTMAAVLHDVYIYMHMNTNDVYIRVGAVASVLTTTT